jgi:hypothetical protein
VLYDADRIAAVLPFRHRPLKMDGSEGTPLVVVPQMDAEGI